MKAALMIPVGLIIAGCQSSPKPQSANIAQAEGGGIVVGVGENSKVVRADDATKAYLLGAVEAAGKCLTLQDIKAQRADLEIRDVMAAATDLRAEGKLSTQLLAPNVYFGLPAYGACG